MSKYTQLERLVVRALRRCNPLGFAVVLEMLSSQQQCLSAGAPRRDMGRPNTNADHLAVDLRDQLMPLRR